MVRPRGAFIGKSALKRANADIDEAKRHQKSGH